MTLRYASWAELLRRVGLNAMAANRRAVEASLRYWGLLRIDHRA